MSGTESHSYLALLAEYEQRATDLLETLTAGDDNAAWRFKWEHPQFQGKSVADVRTVTLDLTDAQLVVARSHGFDSWGDLVAFVEAVLREHPELVRARSLRRHHATLLHYIGANGVEGYRQKTPANAVNVAKILLDAGAEVDALADMYDSRCTTMSMLASSCHPAEAGQQVALAETLLDYGAALDGPGSKWQSSLITALAFGYLPTAQALARRGAVVDYVAAAAGLGLLVETARLLPASDSLGRQIALALAAQHGHVEVVRLLLEAGEDPNRYNPDGFHSHSTPLHQAVWADQADVVRLLVERGARMDIRDTTHHATPLGWAEYGKRTAIAEYLREHGAIS